MTARNYRHDTQGTLLGIPYDWRIPTLAKIASRIANPRAGMFSPKVFGWGWTLNLAHPGSWLLITSLLIVGVTAALAC